MMKKNLNMLTLCVLFAFVFLGSQMHSSKAMEEEVPITFIRPNGTKMLIKVYPDRPLSDLRAELADKGRILPGDVFQREGCDIFLDDEKYWKIREILVDKTLFLKPRESASSNLLTTKEEQKVKNIFIVDNKLLENIKNKEIATTEEGELREKQKIFAIWGSDINISLAQYKKLIDAASPSYDDLTNIWDQCINLYASRKEIASRYMYNSQGIPTYAIKIIENNGITIQSIARMEEGFRKIKKDEKDKKETGEQEILINKNRFGVYYSGPNTYVFLPKIPHGTTIALLHNQLQDEFSLYLKIFGRTHPNKGMFIETINKCISHYQSFLQKHVERQISSTTIINVDENTGKRRTRWNNAYNDINSLDAGYRAAYEKQDHSGCHWLLDKAEAAPIFICMVLLGHAMDPEPDEPYSEDLYESLAGKCPNKTQEQLKLDEAKAQEEWTLKKQLILKSPHRNCQGFSSILKMPYCQDADLADKYDNDRQLADRWRSTCPMMQDKKKTQQRKDLSKKEACCIS